MSILGAKYKAHKFVNIIFYVIVFVFGFLVGIGAKKININTLFSKVLMIDNVNAYTIYSDSNITIDEEQIYNWFSTNFPNFDLEQYPYFYMYPNGSGYYMRFYSKNIDTFSYEGTASNNRYKFNTNGISYSNYYIVYDTSTHSLNLNPTGAGNPNTYTSNPFYLNSKVNNLNTITNFNFSDLGAPTTYNSNNKLDFSEYAVPEMVFDEDLFANDPNFKEVCVNNYDTFSITSNEYSSHFEDTFRTYTNRDAIWFKGNIHGLNTKIYKDPKDFYVPSFYENIYYFDSLESINDIYSTTGLNSIYNGSGYTDKYKYYGYSSHLFQMLFDNSENDSTTTLNIFSFDDPYVEYLDGTKEYLEQFCFYIKTDFDINIMNIDEWGDTYGEISVLGDSTYNIKTTDNIDNMNSQGLFSTLRNFISQIRSVIAFINTNIYNFYMSMPVLVRTFIISVLTIFFVKFIIDTLVR